MIKPFAALLALGGFLLASEAQAQHIFRHARARSVGSYPAATTAPVGYVSGSASSPGAATYPYSYYAALPGRARDYVGYGATDFPFYGQPYGHPYDRWTWPYLSNGGNGLARYYDPPVK